ncbi:MAG: CHAT domain-containing protein [Deltaproteobacteria bacterium]|nr:CHAT domain-containing protein [Deltaproteobacteria bacterium]
MRPAAPHTRPRFGAIAAALLAAGCAASAPQVPKANFPRPRDAVFQDPVPVVKTTYDDLYPSIVATCDLVAYAAKVDGNVDVYVRPLAGGAALRLTLHSADDIEPELSPDGRQVAWTAQAEDVKGDIWVMDVDGGNKRRLTDRSTADRAPTWAPDGRTLYFTARAPGGNADRVDAILVESGARRTVADDGRDPAVSSDGRVLFYVSPDDRVRPRIFARRLADGRIAAVTDGAYLEGFPRLARGVRPATLLFTRWVDDQTGDGAVDADDPPSLWSVVVADGIFAGTPPATPRPLTAGEGGEIFVSVAGDWMVYTAVGNQDLEIYALPLHGAIHSAAGAEAVLAAARAQDNPAFKRLALRYLVATAPTFAASARYELARELFERGRLADAIEELQRVIAAAGQDLIAGVASIEVERLRLLILLRGVLVVREEAERRYAHEREAAINAIVERYPREPRVATRAAVTLAEVAAALGQRQRALRVFEAVAKDPAAPAEDRARAADRLGELYDSLQDPEALARVSTLCLRHFGTERFYARRAADRLVAAARRGVGMSPMAGLQQLAATHADLPLLVARATVALAIEQELSAHSTAALATWRRIATALAVDRETQAEALITLGEAAQRSGDQAEALKAYEQILSEFPERPALRSRAQRGASRMAFAKARGEEAQGDFKAARDSYARLLQADRESVLAHRRYIALSARLHRLPEVLAAYRAAAAGDPRDKLAHYGHGYALTFVTPPPLADAEREIATSLTLDPRFAAGHLTLGWIREQRDRADPRGGWLEKAADSYETARTLVDELSDPELYAAAQLNRGNALTALGKTDDAFAAYLARELSTAAFDDPRTELLFRESFARVALRQGEYDVALDMAYVGLSLSKKLAGRPRVGALTGLVGVVNLLTASYADAASWLHKAREHYAGRRDWVRMIPMLRGEALALEASGRYDEALTVLATLLGHLAKDEGPGPLTRCWPSSFFEQQVPANALSVTRAICGFSSSQEEEIATAITAAIVGRRGYTAAALRFQERRLELTRQAAGDAKTGPRLRLELMLTLAATARAAAHRGELLPAQRHYVEAATIALDELRFEDVATLLASLATLWGFAPESRDPESAAAAEELANRVLKREPAVAVGLRRRVAHWLALAQLGDVFRPPAQNVSSPGDRLQAHLSALDRRVGRLRDAVAVLRSSVEAQGGDGGSLDHLEALLGVAEAPAAGARAAALAAAPTDWRRCFDRALWDRASDTPAPDPAWLEKAIAGFEGDLSPARAPERPAFMEAATELLVARGEIERAWRLLEKDRLLELRPQPARLGDGALGKRWRALRAARDDSAKYAGLLKGAAAVLRALEARPAAVADVQAALEGDAVLLQAFGPGAGHWHWFAIRADGVHHVATPAPRAGTLPPKVADQLLPAEAKASLLYVDSGELADVPAWSLVLGETQLISRFEVSEVLSATYLVAAREARKLGGQEALVLGASRERREVTVLPRSQADAERLRALGAASRLVDLALAGTLESSRFAAAGAAQVVFATDPKIAVENRIDLDQIAALELPASLALTDHVTPAARAARAVAQAWLFAGVATAVVGDGSNTQGGVLDAMLAQLGDERVSTLFAGEAVAGRASSLRLFGHRGLNAKERVDFALDSIVRLAGPGRAAFEAAKTRGEASLWLEAKRLFGELGDALAFLRRPESAELLAKSSHKYAKVMAPNLKKNEVANQKNLGTIHIALKEVDDAAALQEMMLHAAEADGDQKGTVEATRDLGAILYSGKRFPEAAAALRRCTDLAAEIGEPLLKADCLKKLGSAMRELFDYQGAVRVYNEAIMIYAAKKPVGQVEARRYLGFLYADVLNKYDKALEQFQAALSVARLAKLDDDVIAVLLDIARVYRSRGEYEPAIAHAQEAETLLGSTEPAAADRAKVFKARADVGLEVARIYWYRGNYRRALDRQRQALDAARRAPDDFREIQALSLAGLIALNQGELDRAEKSIGAALELSRLKGRQSEEAAQLNNLGIVLRQAGRLGEAVEKFRAALKIDEERGSVEGRAFDLRNLAVALNRQDARDEAEARVEQALELSRAIGSQYNEVQSLLAAGEILEAEHDPRSQQRYEEAVTLARRTAVAEVEWRAVYALGRLAVGRKEPQVARRAMERALAVAERLGRGQAESSAEVSRDDLYADAIALSIDAGDLGGAYLLTERARGRAILDVLATRTLELPSPRAKTLLDADLQAQDAHAVALREAGAETTPSLRQAEAARVAARQALRAEFPRLARLFTIDPVGLDKLQAKLPEGTTVLSYFVSRRQTYAIVIDRREAHAFTLAPGLAELRAAVQELKDGLRAFAAVDDRLAALAHTILEPLAATLTSTKTLVVLPHGPLHYVPFAALPLGGAPLVEHVVVSVAPSGSSFFDTLSVVARGRARTIKALAPDSDLVFATLEATAIGGPGALLGAAATETALRATVADAVDVAAHGRLDPRDPLASALMLVRSPQHDGNLEVSELFALPSVPALMSLSGCDTEASESQGNEWLGLGSALLAAGARSVVASTSRVSDLATAVLMKRFYRFNREQPTGEALRQAALLVRRYFPHPAHWATFVLIGDYR